MTDDEAHRLVGALRRLTGAFTEIGVRFGEQHGLSRSDVAALIVVTEVSEQGRSIGTVELARRIGLAAPSATVLVDRLVAAGLLARHPHPGDRRRVVLALTPAARNASREHFGAVNDRLLRMLSGRPAPELRSATALIERAAELVVEPDKDACS